MRKKLSSLQNMHLDFDMYRVFRKNCVFHCIPSLANIALRDLQSSQRNASVQSLLLAGNFYNQQQPSAGEGEVANFREFLGMTQYLMNTLYFALHNEANFERREQAFIMNGQTTRRRRTKKSAKSCFVSCKKMSLPGLGVVVGVTVLNRGRNHKNQSTAACTILTEFFFYDRPRLVGDMHILQDRLFRIYCQNHIRV